MVRLYRRQDLQPDRAVVRSTLARKCEFKGIVVPTYAALTDRPERTAIEVEWEQMLAHQLPTCPPFAEFWQELPEVFEWLNEAIAAPTFAAVPSGAFGRDALDATWRCRRWFRPGVPRLVRWRRSALPRPPVRKSAAQARRASPKPFGQTGLSHTFACTACGKTFKSDKYDSTLNPHKNKQGWPCPGRTGFLKGTST